MPRTAAVIVNHNGLRFLREHSSTLLSQSGPFARIIVVDNGSQDGSVAYLRAQSGLEVVPLDSNRGFCGGANRGITTALRDGRIDCVALINNDVALEPDWHREAWGALSGDRAYGSCATCLLQAAAPGRVDTAGIVWHTSGCADNYLTGEPAPAPGTPVRAIFGACAAAALYRREFFEQVGLFDEALFAYQEDVDIAIRGQRAGWQCVFAPAARGYHVGFGSNRSFPLGGTYADFYNARNRLRVLMQSLPAAQWRTHWKPIVGGQWHVLASSVRERRRFAIWLGVAAAVAGVPAALRRRRVIDHTLSAASPAPAGEAP